MFKNMYEKNFIKLLYVIMLIIFDLFVFILIWMELYNNICFIVYCELDIWIQVFGELFLVRRMLYKEQFNGF